NMLPVVPSALVQVRWTSSTAAPAKLAGVVTVSWWTALDCTVQEPSAFCAAPSMIQPDGRSFTVTVTAWPSDGSVSERLIGSPAVPAGLRPAWLAPVLRFPAPSLKAPALNVAV